MIPAKIQARIDTMTAGEATRALAFFRIYGLKLTNALNTLFSYSPLGEQAQYDIDRSISELQEYSDNNDELVQALAQRVINSNPGARWF